MYSHVIEILFDPLTKQNMVKFERDKLTPSRASMGLKFYENGANLYFMRVIS